VYNIGQLPPSCFNASLSGYESVQLELNTGKQKGQCGN
jgi:hypothetical protein